VISRSRDPQTSDFRFSGWSFIAEERFFWGDTGMRRLLKTFDVRLGIDVYAGLVCNQGE
jgi:hypothetical protein